MFPSKMRDEATLWWTEAGGREQKDSSYVYLCIFDSKLGMILNGVRWEEWRNFLQILLLESQLVSLVKN